MIRRSITTGLLIGVFLIVVAVYPLLLLYSRPQLLLPDLDPTLRHLLLLLNAALAGVVLLCLGSVAAWRSGASDTGQGCKAGAVSGLVAGLMLFALLVAPTTAIAASARLWAFQPTPQAPYPPDAQILDFLRQMTVAAHARMDLGVLAAVLLGGLEGAFVGLLRSHRPPVVPSLLDVVGLPQARRLWFAHSDDTWQAGIKAGLVGGGVMWLSITVIFFSNLKVEWPSLQNAIMDRADLMTRVLFNDNLLNCLFPLFILAVLGTGGLAVLLLKDPPRRHLSRFQAVVMAGIVAALVINLAVMQVVYTGMGVFPYLARVAVLYSEGPNPPAELYLDAESLVLAREYVTQPLHSAPAYFLVPSVLLAVVLVVVLFWLAPQAALYGLTLPLLFRRPVDRGARLARAVQAEPGSLLPRVYGLYTNDDRAIKILPHAAFLLKDPTAARVVAAYHSLSTEPAGTERATAIIRQTLVAQDGWRWRTEIGELYRILEEGLSAKTLAQVTAIEPPPRDITSSLPPFLARSCEGVGRILDELKKVERVDDLNTKIIFLNSAQAVLLELQRRLANDGGEPANYKTPYPEIAILDTLLSFWQGFILTATRDLQGRANLSATLLTPRTAYAPRVRQCIVVSNNGLNVAQNVRLRVADGEGYQVIEGAEQSLEILSPQESRELEFWLAASGPQRLRLAWHLAYDDAVDTGRHVQCADAMELLYQDPGRPFQRIFPIPYVTGTPLRSGEMFVGREDVFQFVREHLVGTYQNNVIVLHGQRRTGKTSILYRLQQVLADSHVAVLVDMQGKAARGTADFLHSLSDDIVYALEGHDVLVELPPRAEFEQAPEFTFRSRFLRAVVAALDGQANGRGRNLLLMFDEFEELQKRVEDGRLEPEIFPFLRNLMQHEPRLDFVFSGTHKLEELGAEYWSILFNIAAYKRITFLDPAEVRRLAAEPVQACGMEYDPLALDRIVQVTAGHPYFTQVVCHEMVAYHNEVQRSYLTATCVDQVLERIIERGEAHFKYIWTGTTPDEQKVMLALSDLLPDPDAGATPCQLDEELERKGYALSEDARAHALALLQAKDIVSRSGPQSSLYRFKIDLIRRWITITRPLPAAA